MQYGHALHDSFMALFHTLLTHRALICPIMKTELENSKSDRDDDQENDVLWCLKRDDKNGSRGDAGALIVVSLRNRVLKRCHF